METHRLTRPWVGRACDHQLPHYSNPWAKETITGGFLAGLSPGVVLLAKGLRNLCPGLRGSLQGQVRWARPACSRMTSPHIREVIGASAETLLPNKVTATGAGGEGGAGKFGLEPRLLGDTIQPTVMLSHGQR